jgi:hypothetical protein
MQIKRVCAWPYTLGPSGTFSRHPLSGHPWRHLYLYATCVCKQLWYIYLLYTKRTIRGLLNRAITLSHIILINCHCLIYNLRLRFSDLLRNIYVQPKTLIQTNVYVSKEKTNISTRFKRKRGLHVWPMDLFKPALSPFLSWRAIPGDHDVHLTGRCQKKSHDM